MFIVTLAWEKEKKQARKKASSLWEDIRASAKTSMIRVAQNPVTFYLINVRVLRHGRRSRSRPKQLSYRSWPQERPQLAALSSLSTVKCFSNKVV